MGIVIAALAILLLGLVTAVDTVFHMASGLPRLVIQPSGHECPVNKPLSEIDLSKDENDETLAALGYSYTLHLADPSVLGHLMTPERAAHFDRLDDADRSPATEVLPDRVLFFRPRRSVEGADLGTFLAEGRELIRKLGGIG